MAENDDLELDEGLDDEAGDGSGDDEANAPAPAPQDAGDDEQPDAGSAKRIAALMSKADTETARANKAEGELKKLRSERGTTGEPEAGTELVDMLRDSARSTIYTADPRLARYKVKPEAITGSTPTEMRASYESLRSTIDSMESAIRAEVMREHGIDPSIATGSTEKIPSFGSMSDKEFNEFLEKRSGGALR